MNASSQPRKEQILFWIVVLLGLSLHIYAASVTWIGADQALLLRRGVKLAAEGTILPFGKLLPGPGTNPGILLQLFFGVPMYLLHDYRSPMIVIILMHIGAFILLSSVMRKVFGTSILLPFAIVYWLSPWRIYNASLLWEPSFIYLPAALHLWSSFALRKEKKFMSSALFIASIVWAMQIHNSFLILLIAAVILIWKRKIVIDWSGALLGFCIGAITLIPSILAIIHGDLHYDGHEAQGFIGNGLVTVYPTLKGVLYWFTLGSVDAVRQLKETSFWDSSRFFIYSLQIVCILSVLISIRASWWYFRPLWEWRGNRPDDHQTSNNAKWIRSYALIIFLSMVICAALSPSILQGWHVVSALHAAVIPVAVWAAFAPHKKIFSGLILYATFEVFILIVIFSGQFIFNRNENIPRELDPIRDSILIDYIPPR